MTRRPTVSDIERLLRKHYPEVEDFPLLRTLSFVAWELDIPQKDLLRTLKKPRAVLWYRRGKIYVPPDIYLRWKQGKEIVRCAVAVGRKKVHPS